MNNDLTDNQLNNYFDIFTSERNKLFLELKNDSEMTKEKYLNMKISILDNITKNIIKYRNVRTKEKIKSDS